MTEHSDRQWNNDEIARHLKSAMDTLTPDVLDRINLQTPQDIYAEKSKVMKLYQRMRTAGMVAAACLCVAVLGSGVALFQNSRVDSFIAIDVNPSIELSVNRNDKVLKAEALNDDAVEILDDMNLKNVDLNIAVNAVIGSMARHGFLEGEENAILVTVSNDDRNKATKLRQDVVVDIEASLEEHKLQAVVYDQQAAVTAEVTDIADRYGISYGKAYFLQELIDENGLSEKELELYAGMTMEEISREIADRSYNVRKDESEADAANVSEQMEASKAETVETIAASVPESSLPSSEGIADTTNAANLPSSQTPSSTAPTAAAETKEEEVVSSKKPTVDYVDYYEGTINVVFKDKVKWKNPTVSVKDENGESYSAKFTDTSSDGCEISVSNLPGGMNCTFTINGAAVREGGSYGSVKGYFDTPEMPEDEPTTKPEETVPPVTTPPEAEPPVIEVPTAPQETSIETQPAKPTTLPLSEETETAAGS